MDHCIIRDSIQVLDERVTCCRGIASILLDPACLLDDRGIGIVPNKYTIKPAKMEESNDHFLETHPESTLSPSRKPRQAYEGLLENLSALDDFIVLVTCIMPDAVDILCLDKRYLQWPRCRI